MDFHVHCRESRNLEGSAENVGHALEVAALVGVDAIGDMPNTNPPIISREQVVKRLDVAKSYGSNVFYGLHIGLTSGFEQIREAVETYREFFPRQGDKVGVIGLKMYAGRSVGDLAVVDVDKQMRVYETLENCRYRGVLVVHCEKESLMRPELWTPEVPQSHSFARPAGAELESIRDQVGFVYNSDFRGTLHVAHISVPESVNYVRNIRNNEVRNINITCGGTPHHLFLNFDMMDEGGLIWKVNPPLRSESDQQGLLDCLKKGKINWIETDHAPHLLENKTSEPFMSGIPGLDSWPKVVRRLRGEGFNERRIRELTRENALAIYGIPEGVVADSKGISDIELSEYPYGYGDFI